jgi:hypothetical protein
MVGGLRAGVGATLAAGAGVGAEVFGAEEGLSCPPANAIFWNSSKNASIVYSSILRFYSYPLSSGK